MFHIINSMPLEGPDRLHLCAAVGYIELAMFEEANRELEEIDPFCRHLPGVLLARLATYHGLKKWELLAVVAKKLAEWNSKEPSLLIELAYATRRTESIHAAHAILTRAASLHPADATIQFNLACYEAQMGRLELAKTHLKRAIQIDAKFKLLALEVSDLEPLWVSLSMD
jgi:tetratricopeptide (TPR) repeat protein